MGLYETKTGLKAWPERDVSLSLALLAADPLFDRIPGHRVPELLQKALSAGAKSAAKMLERYRVIDPLSIARNMGVRVIFDITEQKGTNPFNVLSCYMSAPPTIVIYETVLRKCRERLASDDEIPRDFLVKLTSICVAHELYHHVERQEYSFVNLSFRAPILDLKLFRIEKSLTMLSEVAANSFAKKLMGLPILPCAIHEKVFGDDSAPMPLLSAYE